MSTPKFEYRGDLSTLPLPEILSTIHRYRVPGVVSVSRDGRMRRVYVDEGLVTFADSNERELGLAAFLLSQGARRRSGNRATVCAWDRCCCRWAL